MFSLFRKDPLKCLVGHHLVTPRTRYTHHGICIAPGEVIHYAGFAEGHKKDLVRRATLSEFQSGRELYVRLYQTAKHRKPDAIARAQSRLGEDRYSLVTQNCEHFATWCITGVHESSQVTTVIKALPIQFAAGPLLSKWIQGLLREESVPPYLDLPVERFYEELG